MLLIWGKSARSKHWQCSRPILSIRLILPSARLGSTLIIILEDIKISRNLNGSAKQCASLFLCFQFLDAFLFFFSDAIQHRCIGIFPVSSRCARHIGHGTRKLIKREISFSSSGGHAALANPSVSSDNILSFFEKGRPGRFVSKLRCVLYPCCMADKTYPVIYLLS